MNYINTEIDSVIVEIEEKEYPVAEKTIETAEKLAEAAKACVGQPEYKLWLAELEVLIGKNAVREIFNNGKKENIDRIQRIHAGVLRAFEHNADHLQQQETERQQEVLAPLTELLRQLAAVNRSEAKKTIRRS